MLTQRRKGAEIKQNVILGASAPLRELLQPGSTKAMNETLPRVDQRPMRFSNGTAIGMSQRWIGGQCCAIQTAAGIVGCGIYALDVPAEFDQAIAIACGTPANPLAEPEDLLNAKIVGCTPKAESFGIRAGMTGREAVEKMLAAEPS